MRRTCRRSKRPQGLRHRFVAPRGLTSSASDRQLPMVRHRELRRDLTGLAQHKEGFGVRAYQDFREFISALDQERQLLRVTEEVKFEPDLAAAACALARIGEGVPGTPAVLFNKIAGSNDA